MVYLDNAATTRPSTEVVNAMMPYLTERYGNPTSKYPLGRKSRKAIEYAREQVANLIHAEPEQIVFTSGGSEGNSMVFAGIRHLVKGKGVVITNAEHESVWQSANYLAESESDCKVFQLHVKEDCTVELSDLEEILSGNEIVLVSTIYVNNETGAINPVKKISELCHKYGALHHIDCVQALGCENVNMKEIGCDFATFSSHKIHGPKGVGALYVKDAGKIESLIKGTQEQRLRGGTENVAGIVGFGEACETLDFDPIQIGLCGTFFLLGLHKSLSVNKFPVDPILNGNPVRNMKILSIRVDGIDSETLVSMLGEDVCISAGSACHANEQEPSRVLLAMGLSEEEAHNTFRVSFSKDNTMFECLDAGMTVGNAIAGINEMKNYS